MIKNFINEIYIYSPEKRYETNRGLYCHFDEHGVLI